MCYCGKLCYDIPRLTFVIVSEITSKDCNICTGIMHTPVYTIVVIGPPCWVPVTQIKDPKEVYCMESLDVIVYACIHRP